MPLPTHDVIQRAATEVAAALPFPAGWPRTGRAWPTRHVKRQCQLAGWPVVTVPAVLPADGHTSGTGRGGTVEQEVACVPLTWLTDLARRLAVPLAEISRGTVRDE